MNPFMEIAVSEAKRAVESGDGGPFGAVVIRNGKIVASSHNEVLKTKDPTAHAEMLAIKRASSKLKRFDLSDCELYSTCEPCPMCLGAVLWARIGKIYYGAAKTDAAKCGFADGKFYRAIKSRKNNVIMIKTDRKECLVPMELWRKKADKTIY
jgi:guanine deaminase